MLFHRYTGSSFIALLKAHYPELVPSFHQLEIPKEIVRSTTIAALCYHNGVLIAGDRRATIDGHLVVSEDVVKVFRTDDHSALAIAGTFGPSVKMARLFTTELEHYEKMEGTPLTLEGKANKLSQLIEQHFPAAVMGLPVMPIFVGYDTGEEKSKIFEYDITGGTFTRAKHEPFAASGSGGERAKSTFEHFFREGLSRKEAVELMVKALSFAAKRDAATSGNLFLIKDVSEKGVVDIPGYGEEK